MSERASKDAASQMRELKVSAHTMALEPGLFCVFNAPGSPMVAPDSGLPGVRITCAPGPRSGNAALVGFNADGWIGPDSAALVRVTGTGAEVLVTVYQAKDSAGEAPKLQVIQLASASASAPGAAAQDATPAARKTAAEVETVAHIYARGDVGGRLGDWMGEPGSNKWIEGFGISPLEDVPPSDVEYQAVLGRGWLSPWSEGGQFCGSRGMSLPILGLRVRLRGASAESHRVVLSASFVDGSRVGPVGDGEPCEAPSLAALEAFQVAFQPLGRGKSGPKGKAAAKPDAKQGVKRQPKPDFKTGRVTPVAVEVRVRGAKSAQPAKPPAPAPAPTPAPTSAPAPQPRRPGPGAAPKRRR